MEELNKFTNSIIKRMLDSDQKYKNHLDVSQTKKKGRFKILIIFSSFFRELLYN